MRELYHDNKEWVLKSEIQSLKGALENQAAAHCSVFSENEYLKAELKREKECVDFYATHKPMQFPEGYYEICSRGGIGGHDRFGTRARETQKQRDKGE